MKGRASACLSLVSNGFGNLIAPNAANYQGNFTGATLLFAVGTAAKLGDSTILAYVSFALSAGMVAVGSRQYLAARFFQQQNNVQVAPAEEKFHDAVEGEEAKIKKLQ